MADEDTKKKLKLRKLFRDVIERNIRECIYIVSGGMGLENWIKSNIKYWYYKEKSSSCKEVRRRDRRYYNRW